jgi:hypothetical protein
MGICNEERVARVLFGALVNTWLEGKRLAASPMVGHRPTTTLFEE